MSGSPTAVGVKQCRICGSGELEQFLDLGRQPLANAFVPPEKINAPEPTFPLRVLFCPRCSLAQLGEVVDPAAMFSHYVYHSSGMPAPKHFRDYATAVVERFIRSPQDLFVEIGSNDGHFLAVVQERKVRVLGIDPAQNIAAIANARGVPTLPVFFSQSQAQKIRRDHGPAHVMVGNNVVAHIHDHHDLVLGIVELLAPDGVLVLEAPYLADMFENLTYDTIYHEHLSYLAVRPLVAVFGQYGLEIFDVQLHASQGQSLRAFVARRGAYPVQPSVGRFVARELELGMDQRASYRSLAERIFASRSRLQNVLQRLKAEGKRIAGYGAPAKGNTILNFCHIGPEILEYAHEDLPAKVGLLTSGMHIPVVDRAHTQSHLPDYFLLLAWNYTEPILKKETAFRSRGGKFIIPVGDEIRVL